MRKGYEKTLAGHLPQYPGIHGRREYPNFVVMVLLTLINDEYHFVFQERSAGIRQGGEICFPGGMFDPGVDLDRQDTALRETSEELGIPEEGIRVLGRLDTMVAPMGAVIDVFVGIMEVSPGEVKINRSEVERIFTIPVSYFEENEPDTYSVVVRIYSSEKDMETGEERVYLPVKELGLPDRYLEPWGNMEQKVFVFKTAEAVVWGLTARIIMDFIRILRESKAGTPYV